MNQHKVLCILAMQNHLYVSPVYTYSDSFENSAFYLLLKYLQSLVTISFSFPYVLPKISKISIKVDTCLVLKIHAKPVLRLMDLCSMNLRIFYPFAPFTHAYLESSIA